MSKRKYKKAHIRVYIPNELVGSCHPFPDCLVHLPRLTEYCEHGVAFWYITSQNAHVSELEYAIYELSEHGYKVSLEMM